MSRTVRTTPRQLRIQDIPSESMSLYDLRYAHAELARATREGRRPAPAKLLHRITSWPWMELHCRKGSFSAEIATAERRARLQGRLAAQRIRGLHHAGHDLDDADVPPVRHRHDGLWNAW
ncbi:MULTISPECIES: hypothetical protein [Streptomyces]|uniref:Uncharacterized protein n=1 Tax=Streptomyces koelreuteriae TaxID=2838015 RepID=A0ABX8FQV3_9ACTN|nr:MULTISPECIES: hypothetical protein [Streptomyces]QWB23497.1 hypothetical protein KJK29_13260 [Streptomyces koelreuteriae]UUA06452.1 hypothetical protein NNW98_13320 [Streptomyces koelreuteriae]UUA14081.1 hypothetical protein NNW99_13320 [Streptomyces sp. CRCS-T-1]